jgi:hypothetical protein
MLKRTPRRMFKTFTGHAPKVKIIKTSSLGSRKRVAAFRKRESSSDPIRKHTVHLHDSEVDALVMRVPVIKGYEKSIAAPDDIVLENILRTLAKNK